MQETAHPLAWCGDVLLPGKVIHGLLSLALISIAHLKSSSVIRDPEIQICLGSSGKLLQDTGGSDLLHHRTVHAEIPVGSGFLWGRIVPGAEAHVVLVDFDLL